MDFHRALKKVEDAGVAEHAVEGFAFAIDFNAGEPNQGMSFMGKATLFGATYSVYVRIARLAMEEAGMPYDLVEVDVFSKDGLPANYAARHPFGKIPAFEHDGFRLFETDAIAQYAVGVSGNRNLMPEAPRERSRVIQIMRIMDNYAYPSLVWGVFVKEVERGRPIEPEKIERARNVLAVLDGLMGRPFLAGDQLTLADLWAAPMFAYFRLAPTGRELLGEFPALQAWTDVMFARPSFMATRYPAELETGAA